MPPAEVGCRGLAGLSGVSTKPQTVTWGLVCGRSPPCMSQAMLKGSGIGRSQLRSEGQEAGPA